MNIRFAVFLTLSTALLMLTGCAKNDEQAISQVFYLSTQQQQTTVSPPKEAAFKSGTWLCMQGDTPTGYYFFDADGSSGRMVGLENGTGLGFAYTLKDGGINLSMGSADNTITGAVTKESDEKLLVQWSTGVVETFSYVSEQGSDTFTFYSDDDLCKMAINYYVKNESEKIDAATISAAAASDGNNSVTIQVYVNLSDHNSNLAWYSVDRLTAKGINTMDGQSVDLTQAEG